MIVHQVYFLPYFQIEQTLKDVDLQEKADVQAGKLSGGQKRKLSVGIALIGDPKVERVQSSIESSSGTVVARRTAGQQAEWSILHLRHGLYQNSSHYPRCPAQYSLQVQNQFHLK